MVSFAVCRFADGKLRSACPTNDAVFLMVIFSKIENANRTINCDLTFKFPFVGLLLHNLPHLFVGETCGLPV